jgi:hypothetical protein
MGSLALVALASTALALGSQGQAGPVVRVDFSNPGLNPSHWTLILHPDGSGHFRSERGNAPAARAQASDSPQIVAPDQDRDIQLSAKFAGRVFQSARSGKWTNKVCESHRKVAFQGLKKLSYTGPEGQISCEFNYSSDKEIQELGDSLVGVASTILEGARLETLLQHDRLGLDEEMEYVTEAEGDGQIQQICAIRGILERLAGDPAVMERVRKRARVLLEKAEE